MHIPPFFTNPFFSLPNFTVQKFNLTKICSNSSIIITPSTIVGPGEAVTSSILMLAHHLHLSLKFYWYRTAMWRRLKWLTYSILLFFALVTQQTCLAPIFEPKYCKNACIKLKQKVKNWINRARYSLYYQLALIAC